MKKFLLVLSLLAGATAVTTAQTSAFPKALYVKKGEAFTKYNFGVAGDLKFSNNGHTLTISGYSDVINLDEIDYITFTAPVSGSALTPDAQKEKMIQIGEEINSYADVNRNAEMIKMIDNFLRDFNHSGYAYVEYSVDPEYWDVHHEFNDFTRALAKFAKGNASAIREVRTRAVNLYKLSDYFGVFKANSTTRKWEKTGDAQYLEIQYTGAKGEQFTARLEGSQDVTEWNTADFNLQLPRTMTMTLAKDGAAIGTVKIASEFINDSKISQTVTYSANGYVVESAFTILDSGITDVLSMTIDGKHFMTANTGIDGKNLVNYAEMKGMFDDMHAHDEWGECYTEYGPLYAHVFRGHTDVDVLGKLQAKGKIFSLERLKEGLSDDDEEYKPTYVQIGDGRYQVYNKLLEWNPNTGILKMTYDDRAECEKPVKYLNNYCDAQFFYDGTAQVQGFMAFNVAEDSWDRWSYEDETIQRGYYVYEGYVIQVDRERVIDSATGTPTEDWGPWKLYVEVGEGENIEYRQVTVNDADVLRPSAVSDVSFETVPVLLFPDGTSYEFEDYFTETAFSSLVNDYETLLDNYYSLTGQTPHSDSKY